MLNIRQKVIHVVLPQKHFSEYATPGDQSWYPVCSHSLGYKINRPEHHYNGTQPNPVRPKRMWTLRSWVLDARNQVDQWRPSVWPSSLSDGLGPTPTHQPPHCIRHWCWIVDQVCVPGQDTEHQIAAEGIAIGVCECVNVTSKMLRGVGRLEKRYILLMPFRQQHCIHKLICLNSSLEDTQ